MSDRIWVSRKPPPERFNDFLDFTRNPDETMDEFVDRAFTVQHMSITGSNERDLQSYVRKVERKHYWIPAYITRVVKKGTD